MEINRVKEGMLEFIKMHGCGNDFIVIDARNQDVSAFLGDTQAIAQACDRHFGVGCDQLIVIQNHASADAEMLIWNADGSRAGMCGNAARCVANTLLKETGKPEITLQVATKTLKAWMDNGTTVVDMGQPLSVGQADVGLNMPQGFTVDMGNPHIVFIVGDAEKVDLEKIGPQIERHAMFPNRTNVEFISRKSDGSIRMRVWERGAGVTLACGSGACASAQAAVAQNLGARKMQMHMDGGTLTMEVRETDGHILMAGPVATSFSGVL